MNWELREVGIGRLPAVDFVTHGDVTILLEGEIICLLDGDTRKHTQSIITASGKLMRVFSQDCWNCTVARENI